MVDKPLHERVSADVREVSEVVCLGEVVAFSFPGEVGGTEFEGRHGASLGLGCVKVKVEKGICLRSVRVWPFMV